MQQHLLDGFQLTFGQAQVDHEVETILAHLALNVLLNLLMTDIEGELVGGEAEVACPGLGGLVAGSERVDAGPALATEEGGCLVCLGLSQEGRVEVAEWHNDLLGGVARGWESVEHSAPPEVGFELLHVHIIQRLHGNNKASLLLVINQPCSPVGGILRSASKTDWSKS